MDEAGLRSIALFESLSGAERREIVMTGQAFRSMARILPSIAERITSAVEERSRALVDAPPA
ncbi:MAG TPA: hypothetical protein VER75_01560 [Thermoleophilaceae bacterium]|nr:hypothetical protein [Thermoleophilaceae bacterium]